MPTAAAHPRLRSFLGADSFSAPAGVEDEAQADKGGDEHQVVGIPQLVPPAARLLLAPEQPRFGLTSGGLPCGSASAASACARSCEVGWLAIVVRKALLSSSLAACSSAS